VFRVLPPWSNLWLLGAIAVSMILHILILYVPALSLMFSVCAREPAVSFAVFCKRSSIELIACHGTFSVCMLAIISLEDLRYSGC